MATDERPTFIKGDDGGVRICRVEVPQRDGSNDVLFMREDQTAPWQALGADVKVTPLDDGPYVPMVTPEERGGE